MKLSHPVYTPALPGRLFDIADAFFGDFFGNGANLRVWSPAVNVVEDASGYRVVSDLPGVASGDVKVIVRDGVLTISGERKSAEKVEGEKYHISERVFGSFQRSFTLPKDADGERVTAAFKDGVLTVSIPKRPEAKAREIEVAVG